MKIAFITGNTGKIREISRFLSGLEIELYMEEGPFIEIQADSLEEVVTTGMDLLTRDRKFDGALIKEDSGLFISSLNGFPGVYSAYVQKTIGNKGVLSLMKNERRRDAVFRTVIGLMIPGEGLSLFRGECRGTIGFEERGRQGFGYDPIFIPQGEELTFAEMNLDEKNRISHRTRAVQRMVEFLKKR
jgi:XTP/dITP diphosphohydrolase